MVVVHPKMGTRFREDQLVVDFLLFSLVSFFGFVQLQHCELRATLKGFVYPAAAAAAAAGAEFLLNIRIETTRQLMV